MVKKKRFNGTIIYGVLLFVIYLLLFPPGTGKELIVKPERLYNLAENSAGITGNYNNNEKTTSFQVGEVFGYIDSGLNLLYQDTINFNIALSDSGFINYSSIQEGEQGLVYRDFRGEVKSSFHFPGYPMVSRDGKRIFIVKTDATGLKEISMDGEELWGASFPSIITAFCSQNEYSLAGLLNGNLKLYNGEGKCLYSVSLKSAKAQSVYGCALSKGGKEIGAVYGLSPQRLVLIKRDISNFQKPLTKDIDTDFRRPVFIDFSDDGKYLFVEGNEKIMIMNIDSDKSTFVPFTGRFAGLYVSRGSTDGIILTRTDNDNKPVSRIYVFRPPQLIFIEETSLSRTVSVKLFGKYLLIGLDMKLLILGIGEA
jgi:hypothetical protein